MPLCTGDTEHRWFPHLIGAISQRRALPWLRGRWLSHHFRNSAGEPNCRHPHGLYAGALTSDWGWLWLSCEPSPTSRRTSLSGP